MTAPSASVWAPAISPRPLTGSHAAGEAFHPLVRWSLYLFVFSLPFEWPQRSIPVEITTLTGTIFLLTTLIQPGRCYARLPAAVWCFAATLVVFWMSFIIGGGTYPADVAKSFFLRFENLLTLWAGYNLMRDDRVATRTWLVFGIACFTLAAFTLGGAVNLNDAWVKKSGRVTLFGQNANHAGLILAAGALALVGLTYGRDRKLFRPRLLVWPLLILIGIALVKTGSRGSLLSLTLGLWTFTVAGRDILVKLRNSIVAILAVVLLAAAAWQLPLMRERFTQAGEGDLAGRERIFPAAWGLFLERPLLGWGPAQNKYELARRVPEEFRTWRDTHNLVLELITSLGVIGALPFLLGVGACAWGAWRGRHGNHGILPLAMIIALLMGNMSGNYIGLKLFWLALAWGAAAGSLAASNHTPARIRGMEPC